MGKRHIAVLEPFYGGSHRRWVDGLKRHSRHAIQVFTLPDRHWKWRMHGAAVTFARQLVRCGTEFDLILASDLMDVAVLRGLLSQAGHRIPVATYFHENQLTYPVSPRDTDRAAGRDRHYAFINYTSALASDAIFFNSGWHRDSFLEALPDFLSRFPDAVHPETVEAISGKASVLPLGMDLKALDPHKPDSAFAQHPHPLILWNHRWEYDKDPEAFFRILLELDRRGITYDLALLGQRGSAEPETLGSLRERLGSRLLHEGTIPKLADYAAWLWRADIQLVTAIHDFFGGSVVEAAWCGCHPVLPKRLAYPEHFGNSAYWYETESEAADCLQKLIESNGWRRPFVRPQRLISYDWTRAAAAYDDAFIRVQASP